MLWQRNKQWALHRRKSRPLGQRRIGLISVERTVENDWLVSYTRLIGKGLTVSEKRTIQYAMSGRGLVHFKDDEESPELPLHTLCFIKTLAGTISRTLDKYPIDVHRSRARRRLFKESDSLVLQAARLIYLSDSGVMTA